MHANTPFSLVSLRYRMYPRSVMFIVLLLLAPQYVHADTGVLSVTPVVIDEKAQVRDILKETITLTNTSNHKLTLYPSVNNVERADGEQAFAPAQGSEDLAASLANWIELSRGVIELSPGEVREVPFIVHINLNALPNTYHAQLSFAEGSTRAEAEAHGPAAVVTMNLEVQADVKELMQLGGFSTGRFFLAGDDVRFDYKLENIGNQEVQPHGEIRVYDSKGTEVASVDVNKEGKAVSPDQMNQLASVWAGAQGFGRYKALLTVYYGKNQTASVQDTAFFWIVPWKQLLMLFVLGIVGVVFFAFYFHRWLEQRHGMVLAPAGAAPAPASELARAMPHFPRISFAAPFVFAKGAVRAVGKLKRGERKLPERTLEQVTPAAPTPTPVSVAAPAAAPAVQESFRPVPVQTTGTIDLKNLRQSAPEHVVTESHVIDLKRRA